MHVHAQELAILFSGGSDSLALYALASTGRHPDLPKARKIHLLHMLNGMSRFHDFPRTRYEIGKRILASQMPSREAFPDSTMLELDMGRLFQGLWLDRYETLMPEYGGKNLVCVACKLGMHTRAILYCVEHLVPLMVAGYTKRQEYYPEQTQVFMKKMAELSSHFGIETRFPVYNDFTEERHTRHVLEDFGLPSTGGGERKCMFCQTMTTATEKEIGSYLDDMLVILIQYLNHRIAGRIKEAADCFPPGRSGVTKARAIIPDSE